MNPEQRKNHRGGARVQKPESPRREKETKREKKPGRPRTKKQKILLGLYIALTVVAAIIVAGAIVFGLMSAPPEVALPTPTPRHTTIINEQGEEVEVEIPGLSAGRKEQFYTFLVAGVSGGNTDTMLLAAYDVPNQKLSVMSLPRDTYVIYNGRTVMINSVYSRGGGE
ncbi:MAG: LCP family protein, partial [Flavonifractor plautii]